VLRIKTQSHRGAAVRPNYAGDTAMSNSLLGKRGLQRIRNFRFAAGDLASDTRPARYKRIIGFLHVRQRRPSRRRNVRGQATGIPLTRDGKGASWAARELRGHRFEGVAS